MIVRVWEGKTKLEHATIYSKIIKERDIPDYKKTNGFIKLTFMKRSDDEFTYFKLLTFWENYDVIQNFTGLDIDKAKFYDADTQFLVDFPGKISHFEVFVESMKE